MSVSRLPNKALQPIFMVYEHWRPDTGVCFYVGKGHGNRAWSLKHRNRRHVGIQKKLEVQGLKFEVRIIQDGLVEADALALEIERIALYPAENLANMTKGGDGCSGYRHGPEFLEKVRARATGNSWATGRTWSPQQRAKLQIARAKQAPPGLGYKWTDEQKARLAASGAKRMLGHKHSEETRRHLSEVHKAQWAIKKMAREIADYDFNRGVFG